MDKYKGGIGGHGQGGIIGEHGQGGIIGGQGDREETDVDLMGVGNTEANR